MFNEFVIKKFIAYCLASCLPLIAYMLVWGQYDFFTALAVVIGTIVLGYFVMAFLLKNPFTDALEGKGLLVFDVNSTGILGLFNVGVTKSGQVGGNYLGHKIKQFFDRTTIFNLSRQVGKGSALIQTVDGENSKGGLKIEVDAKEYAKARMGLQHLPVLLYNSQTKVFLTKEWISEDIEKKLHENLLIQTKNDIVDLEMQIKDFNRTFLDKLFLSMQNSGMMWIVWVLVGAIFIYLAWTYLPALFGGA